MLSDKVYKLIDQSPKRELIKICCRYQSEYLKTRPRLYILVYICHLVQHFPSFLNLSLNRINLSTLMAFLFNILYYLHHHPGLGRQGMVKEVASQLRFCKIREVYLVKRPVVSVLGALNRRTCEQTCSETADLHTVGPKYRPVQHKKEQNKGENSFMLGLYSLCHSFYRKLCLVFKIILTVHFLKN